MRILVVIWVEWQCGQVEIVVGKRPELSGMSGAEAAGVVVVAVAAVTGVAVTNGGSSPNVVVFAEPTF